MSEKKEERFWGKQWMVSERFLNKFAEEVVGVGIGVEMSKEMTDGFQNSKCKSQKAVPLYKTTHCKTISKKKEKNKTEIDYIKVDSWEIEREN